MDIQRKTLEAYYLLGRDSVLCLLQAELGKVWLLSWLHALSIIYLVRIAIYERSGHKPQFPWQSIVHRRWLFRRNTRGYFRSERKTSVLSSSWKSMKTTCVVVSLHNSATIKLSIERRSSPTFVAVIFFGSPVQNVSQSEACACHFIELTTPFSSAMAFLNDLKLSLTSS